MKEKFKMNFSGKERENSKRCLHKKMKFFNQQKYLNQFLCKAKL